MVHAESTVFVLVDVQGKLASLMHDRERTFANLCRLIDGMKLLDVPILWVEQNPSKMGETLPRLRQRLEPATPIAKMSFSCCGEPSFVDALRATRRTQVILAGIETHVCICQTTADLVSRGHDVHIVADAVSSRTEENVRIGLDRARAFGASLVSTEMILFELMRTAEHPAFRDMLKLVR